MSGGEHLKLISTFRGRISCKLVLHGVDERLQLVGG